MILIITEVDQKQKIIMNMSTMVLKAIKKKKMKIRK